MIAPSDVPTARRCVFIWKSTVGNLRAWIWSAHMKGDPSRKKPTFGRHARESPWRRRRWLPGRRKHLDRGILRLPLSNAEDSVGSPTDAESGFWIKRCGTSFRDYRPTFRIRNASICIRDFLCCTSVTCKISIESIVMTSGVLLNVTCKTAPLAAAPTFSVVIPSFFVCVARLNSDRRRTMTSTYDCQILKPLEQRSIASILQMGLSSWRYTEIDFDMSVRQLHRDVSTPLDVEGWGEPW